MNNGRSIGRLEVIAGLLLLVQVVPFTVEAACYGYLTYTLYNGKKDGDSREAVVCISTTNNPPCELLPGAICDSGMQFTPDPPTHEKICKTGTEDTGYNCWPNVVWPTVTAYKGRPTCGNPCGNAGCVDWDTEPTTISNEYWWRDDYTTECPGG